MENLEVCFLKKTENKKGNKIVLSNIRYKGVVRNIGKEKKGTNECIIPMRRLKRFGQKTILLT